MEDIREMLEKKLPKENIYEKEPMSKHTSFKIGGVADYFLKIESEEELRLVLNLAHSNQIPFYIVGNGTNLLVREGGVRGLVLKLEQNKYKIEKQENFAQITVECGMPLAHLALIALENGLTGLECMAGIPGTVGGAIKMNAGAYGKEMKDIVIYSKCMDKNGNIVILNWEEHEFSYRKSAFAKNELILLETDIKLTYGNPEEIKQNMERYKQMRLEKQPLEFPNAGSIFKRKEEMPTAKLIEEAGLKGYSIGGAEVSTKHAGFIVNKGNATAKDVLELIAYIQKIVEEKFNQLIELEIIVIGEE